MTVLEIGAGAGLLTRALRQQYEELRARGSRGSSSSDSSGCGGCGSNVVFKATDVRPPREAQRVGNVERMNAMKALQRHAPSIVVCAWMPSGVDFTSDVRRCATCLEYILLGVPDSCISGDIWATWGIMNSELIDNYGLDPHAVAPYIEEGWRKIERRELSRYSLCRFDYFSGCFVEGEGEGEKHSHPHQNDPNDHSFTFSKVFSFCRIGASCGEGGSSDDDDGGFDVGGKLPLLHAMSLEELVAYQCKLSGQSNDGSGGSVRCGDSGSSSSSSRSGGGSSGSRKRVGSSSGGSGGSCGSGCCVDCCHVHCGALFVMVDTSKTTKTKCQGLHCCHCDKSNE